MDRDRRFRTAAAGGSLAQDRSRSMASNSNSWKDDNLDGHLNGLQPEASVAPQVRSSGHARHKLALLP